MITSQTKKTRTHHLFLMMSIACITTLVLMIGTLVLYTTVFASITSAHAMDLLVLSPNACVFAPTMEHCNDQDPMLQGCSTDAQTIAYTVFLVPSTGNTLATVERRYSPKCHTYWGRLKEPTAGKRGLSVSIAIKGAPPQVSTTTGTVVFTNMVFLSCPTTLMAPIIGAISLKNGEGPAATGVQGLAALLAAVPAPINCFA